ncbi:MmgE/PrpD family protein [Roseibium marinum]|uniref:2-methylcitrate dehydratase PrpD n=1 Tax=Roseibium marinum TaxID=281252 RepID=A0A2S3UN34_9HYPH|nr:MmgE/PrpD family protein [Roseibium marinum]POF29122.1 2-methylcitrate dehydratase PrpD [Roseibium marinum]
MSEMSAIKSDTGSSSTVLEEVVRQSLAFSVADVSDMLAAKARLCLVDFLSCALEAADLPWSRQAAGVAAPYGDSVIIGEAKVTTPDDAAFANAVRGHGLVREDMHTGSIAHLGVVIWPTLLALAETRSISGPEFLRAAILGYEAGGRLGRKVMTPEVARLFRPTGLIGPYAAALAGAAALGLDQETTCAALALAGNCSAGLNEWPHTGSDEMYFHPGFAVRNAIRSIRLAEAGARGSTSIVEGPAGMLAAYARMQLDSPVTMFPGGDAEILSVFNKQVPACNFAQSPCQAAVAALEKAGVSSDRITRVAIDTYDAALNYPGCAHMGPFRTPLQAKMSIAFGVGAALARGEIAEANYARLKEPEILRLVDATSFRIDEALNAAFPQKQGTRVTLTLDDGREVGHAMDNIAYADAALIRHRFEAAAGLRLGAEKTGVILREIDGMAALADTASIVRNCAADAGSSPGGEK